MKPYLKYVIPGIILLSIIGFFIFKKPKETDTPQVPVRKVEEINKIDLKDRPYVTLTPRADGREVTLSIDNVIDATEVEYELEYQAESLIQGVFGTIDFSEDPLPVSKELLFGSCSKGKCRYDTGVTGGSLTLSFDGGDKPYALKSDFNLQNMFDRQGIFTSKDIKATLDVGKTALADATFVLVASTMGLPENLEGQVLAGPYAFTSAVDPTLKTATLTIQSKEDLTGAKLMMWDGKAYEELVSEISEGKISAPVTSFGTFVVVK